MNVPHSDALVFFGALASLGWTPAVEESSPAAGSRTPEQRTRIGGPIHDATD